MPGVCHKTVAPCSRPRSMDGDNTIIEVIRDDRRKRDKIMICVPLAVEVDEDPLFYYPTPTAKGKKLFHNNHKHTDEEDTASESDSDSDEELDQFDVIHNNNVAYPPVVSEGAIERKIDPQLESSFLEELMQTLDTIFGCSYGGCDVTAAAPVLKSALRRKGSAEEIPAIARKVSWTKLEIREFNMTLGNHPSAVTGPPVMLDWDSRPTREAIVDLETYEKARLPRRTRRELKLSFEARRGILENERGFTVEEVKKAWSEALKIRKQRQETRLRGPHQQLMDEIYESAVRKYNRLFFCQ